MDYSEDRWYCGLYKRRLIEFFFLEEGTAPTSERGDVQSSFNTNVETENQWNPVIPNPAITNSLFDKLKFVWSEARLVAGSSGLG